MSDRPLANFDIDRYLNRFIPRPRLDLLPYPLSFFLGYRRNASRHGLLGIPATNLLTYLFAFLGAFIGITIIEQAFIHLPVLSSHHAPIVIASFGASSILEYNTIETPLAQPRNFVVGQFLASVIGVAITKAFRALPTARFESVRWLAGSIAVGLTSSVMGVTKTVHPPAGATALLAATTDQITELGWWYCALVLLADMLMLVSALLVNNLYKRWPVYWWTAEDLRPDKKDKDVEEKGEADKKKKGQDNQEILVSSDKIVMPDWLELSQFDREYLEDLQIRLREGQR